MSSSLSPSARCGLFHVASMKPVPLTTVSVVSHTYDFSSEVHIEQTFVNPSSQALECVYLFPLDENCAVVDFKAKLDERTLNGTVTERNAAKQAFDKAVSENKTALLLQQQEVNIFQLELGNLKPRQTCVVHLTYITNLDLEGEATRFVLPAIVAPRYHPHEYVSDAAAPVERAPGGGLFSQMTAPLRDVASLNAPTQLYPSQALKLQCHFVMPSRILSITSSSHAQSPFLQTTISPCDVEGQPGATYAAVVSYDSPSTGLERDFVLLVKQAAKEACRAVLEVDPVTGSRAVQLAFCPAEFDPLEASNLKVEIDFLIDRSGSMGGESISAVKQVLQLFLRSLPVNCRFNLISFGSDYSCLFPSAQLYSEQTLATATSHVASMDADMGGTELAAPLHFALQQAIDYAHYPKNVFLLTDGQVSNVSQLVQLVGANASHCRLFTFGIGGGVDRNLVKSLAHAGHGEVEFVDRVGTSEHEMAELGTKVMRQLTRALQPSLNAVSINWDAVNPSKGRVLQCPQDIPALFPPTRTIVYAILPPSPSCSSSADEVDLSVTATSNRPKPEHMQVEGEDISEGVMVYNIKLNMKRAQVGKCLHQLAARARIGELTHQPDDKVSKEITELALKYQLASKFTSFLIIDEGSQNTPQAIHSPAIPQCRNETLERSFDSVSLSAPGCAGGAARSAPQPALKKSAAKPSGFFSSVRSMFSNSSSSSTSAPAPPPAASLPMPRFADARCDAAPAPAPKARRRKEDKGDSFLALAKEESEKSYQQSEQEDADMCDVFGSDDSAAPVSASLSYCSAPAPPPSIAAPSVAAPPPAAAPLPAGVSFQALVQLQQASGQWILNEQLLQHVKAAVAQHPSMSAIATLSLAQLSDAAFLSRFSLGSSGALGTLLALWVLSTVYATRSSEWAMLNAKAKNYLKKEKITAQQINEITQQLENYSP